MTLAKTFSRKSLPKLAANLEEMRIVTAVITIIRKEMPNIFSPVIKM